MSKNTYKTSDLNIAAYLKARFRLDIKESERDKNGRVFFIFDTRKVDIDAILTDYINGKDMCSINLFTRELAGLRNLFTRPEGNK
jgi:hypothetical protein